MIAYDNTSEIYVLESELPTAGSINLSLTLSEWNTAFFNQTNISNYVTLTFPKNLTFNATNTSVLLIQYYIPKFTPVSSQFIINTSINITNNVTDSSSLFGMSFIVNRTTPQIIEFNATNKTIVASQGYNVTIAEILLPKNDTLFFTFKAPANTVVNITRCDSWLRCPSTFTFLTENAVMPINYTVPYNTTLGLYQMNFTVLSSEGVEANGSILFNITTTDVLMRRFVFKEECFTSDGAIKKECIKEYEEYQRLTFQELLDMTFHSIRKNASGAEIVEKLVMVGSVDEELKKLYDSCYQERTVVTLSNNQCNFQRESLLNEKVSWEKLINEKDAQMKENERLVWNQTQEYNLKEDARREKESKQHWIAFGIGLLVVILGAGYWLIYTHLNGENMLGK